MTPTIKQIIMRRLTAKRGALGAVLAQGEDVLRMKGALQGLGDYDPPAYGMTEWPDAPLFDGMKRFQRKNGLAVDGVARQFLRLFAARPKP